MTLSLVVYDKNRLENLVGHASLKKLARILSTCFKAVALPNARELAAKPS